MHFILRNRLKMLVAGESFSPAAKASLWYTICGILQKAIGIVVVPLYTRIMDSTAYGTYTVFQSWYSLLFVFTSLGLANYVFNNGMLKYKSDRDGFTSAMLGLSGASTLIFIITFIVFPTFWSDALGLAAPLVFLLFVRALISPSYEFWSARLRYEFRYKGVVALTLTLTIAVPIVSVPVILLSRDKAAAALICQVIVMCIVYAVPLASILRRNCKFFNKEYWVYALKFNIPLIPSMFATLALQQLNRIVIAGTLGESQAAIFSVAFSIGSVTMFIYSALEQSYRPWFYQGMENDANFNATKIAALLVVIVGGACWLLALFSPEIMMIFAPVEYQGGVFAIAPIAASTVLIMSYSIFITVEYYFEETLPIPVISVLAALANYGLNMLLVPKLGYVAASYVSFFCYFFLLVGHAIACRRAMRRHLFETVPLSISKLFLLTVFVACVIIVSQLFYSFFVIRMFLVFILFVFSVLFCKKIFNHFSLVIHQKKNLQNN